MVALATLASVAAATPAPRWDPVLFRQLANAGLTLGPDDTAYLVLQRSRAARLQAYRPGRAGVAWTVDFPGANPFPIATDDPGLLIVSVFDADPGRRRLVSAVQGRDARTGALLWSRPGLGVLAIAGNVVVLTNRQEWGGTVAGPVSAAFAAPEAPAPLPAGGSIEAVDRWTGRTRWTRALEPGAVLGRASRDGRSLVADLRPDGLLRLRDADTGAERYTLGLALAGRPLSVHVPGLVMVRQDGVGADDDPDVVRFTGPPQTAAAYDPDTGAERWRHDLRLAAPCGDRYLCGYEGDETIVTDPTTGTTVYRGVVDAFGFRDGRLIVSWHPRDPGPAAGTATYDLRTGQRLRSYPGWRLADLDPARSDVVAQLTAGGGLIVGTLDPATGRISVVGRTDGWSGDPLCTRNDRYVGCVGERGVWLWRLPARR